MKHDSIPTPPDANDSSASGPRWTNRKMAEFLRTLAATHSVKAAAKAVGMSRQSAYKLRTRLKGKPFDLAWDEAFHPVHRNIPHAVLERALCGVEVPHYYRGKLVGTSRHYNERVTLALLKLFTSPGILVADNGGPATASEGPRLEALIASILAEGEVAGDGLRSALSPAESANPSPPSDARKVAESRGFDRNVQG